MRARSTWCSWKAAFAESHSACETASAVAVVQLAEAAQLVAADACRPPAPPPAARAPAARRTCSSVAASVSAVHVVAAPRLHGQQALGDEPRQSVVDGAARDAERRRQLVQAHLLARARAPAARAGRFERLVRTPGRSELLRAGSGDRHARDVTRRARLRATRARSLGAPGLRSRRCRSRVRLFAGLRERAGRGALELELPAGARAADVWAALDLGERPGGLAVAVNRSYVEDEEPLSDGDEVALIPPVSGGSSRLVEGPLDVAAVLAEVADEQAGGIARSSARCGASLAAGASSTSSTRPTKAWPRRSWPTSQSD